MLRLTARLIDMAMGTAVFAACRSAGLAETVTKPGHRLTAGEHRRRE